MKRALTWLGSIIIASLFVNAIRLNHRATKRRDATYYAAQRDSALRDVASTSEEREVWARWLRGEITEEEREAELFWTRWLTGRLTEADKVRLAEAAGKGQLPAEQELERIRNVLTEQDRADLREASKDPQITPQARAFVLRLLGDGTDEDASPVLIRKYLRD